MCAVLLLVLLHPQAWVEAGPSLWAPYVGFGLALAAWVGPRTGFLFLFVAAVVVLLRVAVRAMLGSEPDLAALPGQAADVLLGTVTAPLAWWLFQTQAKGSRRLNDPQSATLFLFLVPGLALGCYAVTRTALLEVIDRISGATPGEPFSGQVVQLWLEQALGVLIVAPPLLVNFTPWLLRQGLILPEPYERSMHDSGRARMSLSGLPMVTSPRWGDWIEIAGLTAGASILCLLLTQLHERGEMLGWPLWGVELLVIVWASLRQGLRGGTLVASVAAAFPLLFLPTRSLATEDQVFALLLQGHLLAQCSTALLVAAAASWVRISETGYRRVVSHIPVVIYSAQLNCDLGTVGRTELADVNSLPALPGQVDDSGLGIAEVTLVSAASLQLLGCPPEQLLGDYSRWLGCVHPADREVVLAALAQLARQDEPVTCEYRLVGGDGSSRRSPARPGSRGSTPAGNAGDGPNSPSGLGRDRWLRDTLAPTRDSEGRLIGWEGVVTEITEQRVLADDLRRTTSMFHALVANLPTGVFFVQGPHGRPILVNARARQLLGQREDSAAGLEYLSRVYRLHRPDGTTYPVDELPVFVALRGGRTTMRDDIVVHRPDGRRIPLVTWGAPVNLGGPGTPEAAVWVLEDLTALHQAEAARQDSEGRLRTVIETMAEGLIVQDRRGVITDCNSAACAFLGLPADQLCTRSLFDFDWTFFHEDGSALPKEDHPTQTALRTGRPVRNVVLGIGTGARGGQGASPPSRVRWLLINAMPLGTGVVRSPAEEGTRTSTEPAGVVTTFSDITAYVQAREAIRVSEENYRGLVETLPLMLIQWNQDFEVTYVNPAYRAITGYQLEEIAKPEAWARCVHPDDLPRMREFGLSALQGQAGRTEMRYRTKDGSDRVAFALAQPSYQDGVVVGVTTLLLDVTRERQLERELQRAQRLEVIGRLASGVAHDFNNLLGVMLGLADLARHHLPPEHPAYHDLGRITEAGEQAVGLASQLLAFSRNRNVTTRRIDLHHVVQRTLELLRSSQPAHLHVRAELAPRDLFLQADQTQLQQVLMNLCLNARDAMPHGGLLRIQTNLTWDEGRPFVVLSVVDNGQGMSEEVRQRVFEPFFSTKETGTGLGLAVVQQIVESYGGHIELTSEVGVGSRFDVWWPADLGGSTESRPPASLA